MLIAHYCGSTNPGLKTALARAKVFFATTCRNRAGGISVCQDSANGVNANTTVMGTFLHTRLSNQKDGQARWPLATMIDAQLPCLKQLVGTPGMWKAVTVARLQGWLFTSDGIVYWGASDKALSQNWRTLIDVLPLLPNASSQAFKTLNTSQWFA
jgi:hypothetical protein